MQVCPNHLQDGASQQSQGPSNHRLTMFIDNIQPAVKQHSNFQWARCLLESWPMAIIIIVFTVYSLYGDYVKLLVREDLHLLFNILTILTFLVMLSQFILQLICLQNYLFSFYFWYDIIFPILIVFDLDYVNHAILQSFQANKQIYIIAFFVNFIKILRIARIIKINKIFHKWQKNRQIQKSKQIDIQIQDTESNVSRLNHEINMIHEKQKKHLLRSQTKLARELAEGSIKKIVLILVILQYFIPIFQVQKYFPPVSPSQGLCQNINLLLQNQSFQTNQLIPFIQKQIQILSNQQKQNFMIYFKTPFKQLPYYQSQYFQKQIPQFYSAHTVKMNIQIIQQVRNLTHNQGQELCSVAQQRKYYTRFQAAMDMGKVTFVIILLILIIYFNNKRITELVIIPVQKIIFKVGMISKNPKYAFLLSNDQQEELDQNKKQLKIIQNAIIKTTSLLALVFGTAGAQIIGKNMLNLGQINLIYKGIKKQCIFGFCDIRDFTSITQCLQQDIMIFVNRIAKLVHQVVDQFQGFANKNIGDAFMVVWKTPEDPEQITTYANMALLSQIIIIISLRLDKQITKFQEDYRIQKRMKQGYKIRLGFGLHKGQAIQGPIGSNYKVDASYLSPNVNMSALLQGATKQYNVPLLFSQALFKHLSQDLKEYCRKVDKVSVSDSQQSFFIYTVDINVDKIPSQIGQIFYYGQQFQQNQQNMSFQLKQFFKANPIVVDAIIIQHKQIFLPLYSRLFQSYINGDWINGRAIAQRCLQIKFNDGPTLAMLKQMNGDQSKWRGFRPMP